jgi:peptidoglycan/LPS O-acetylase OafA/YrhL
MKEQRMQVNEKATRLMELDALRGVAAFSVVLFHLSTHYFNINRLNVPSVHFPIHGLHSVYLFFVISGFVIFMTLNRVSTGWEFFVSRFSRLYPAYWASVLLTSIALGCFGDPRTEISIPQILGNLTMLQAWLGIKAVDSVYWSLAAELPFYVIAYLLFVSGPLRRRPHTVALSWIAICLVSMYIERYVLQVKFYEPLKLALLLDFAPLFMAGMLFCLMRQGTATLLTHVTIIIAGVTHNILLWHGLEGIVLTALIFGAFYLLAFGKLSFIAVTPLVWLGMISYPLYLLHNKIGMAIIAKLTARSVDTYVSVIVAIGVSVLLATTITLLVEKPAMRMLRHKALS